MIDYVREITGELCPHCFPNLPDGTGGNRLICAMSDSLSITVTENTHPCTIEDWQSCPLREKN